MIRSALILSCLCTPLAADPAVIENVVVSRSDMGWRFDVTIRHADSGWDHFVDQWPILTPDGRVIATRELMHPHVDEQPFTRSLVDVLLPDGMRTVTVRARCSQGDLSAPVTVTLPR